MKSMKKAFISVVSVFTAVFVMANNAQAQMADKILVKVDEVKAVKGRTAQGDSCEFDVVVFNRTQTDVSGAMIEFQWIDDTITSVVEDENAEIATGSRVVKTNDSNNLSLVLEIPAIPSYKQVTAKASLRSDRCFLLTGEANVIVRRCNAQLSRDAQTEAGVNAKVAAGNRSCAPFEFVSSTNPQFYKEFKKLTIEEQKKLEQSKLEKDKQDIEDEFTKAISTFEEAKDTLKSIRN